MEKDSRGIVNSGNRTNNGQVNEGFVDDGENGSGMRRCHSDTSLNEHSETFTHDENPNDLVTELRGNQVHAAKRTRHVSQPGPPKIGVGMGSRQRHMPPRPGRSPLVSMDGMMYDPTNRIFMKRSANTTESNPDLSYTRTPILSQKNLSIDSNTGTKLTPTHSLNDVRLRNPQLNRIHRNAISVVDNAYMNQPDLLHKSVPRNNMDSRSVSGVSILRSIGPSAKDYGSVMSTEHSMPPSTEREKSRTFRSMLSTVGSSMYAVLLVTVGLIIAVFDVFVSGPVVEYYCIYLIVVGFGYLIYLLVDVRIYISKARKHYKDKRKHEEAYDAVLKMTEIETFDGPLTFTPGPEAQNEQAGFTIDLPPPANPLEHLYCFTQGRHAGSFYLKLGAAVFCLGHLVHSALLLSLEAMYVSAGSDCGSVVVLILQVIYPIYSFLQLFFVFKYSNIIILRNKFLARLSIMHCIGSSLCFWIWTIIRETMDAIHSKNDDYDPYANSNLDDETSAKAFVSQFTTIADELRKNFKGIMHKTNCTDNISFDILIYRNLSPYLYPFTVEYSILIVGIFYIIWANIGSCPKEELENKEEYHDKLEWISDESSQDTEQCKVPTAVDDNGLTSNLVIHVDCHSANKGIFGGILILVITIVSLIMTFVLFADINLARQGLSMLRATDLFLHAVMLTAVVLAYMQIKKLDVNPHPISLLDDILLFICIPAFIMELTFTIIATANYQDGFLLSKTLVMTVQALVQIPFITDALRRCSNSRDLQRSKPGRELITFLIVCNVATWIFETFTIKNAEMNDVRYDFFGKILWSILGHISTPLIMFFRFHSSVCLVDIWKGAYQPGNSH